MISIRKYLDSNGSSAPREDTARPAARVDGDWRLVSLETYRTTLGEVGRASTDACPALGDTLQHALDAIAESLAGVPSTDALASAGQKATVEVRNWGRDTARHYRRKAGEVKEMLLVMAAAAQSVGQRDLRCAQQLHAVTASLKTIASLEDISQVRASIEKSACELRCSIDRMTAEGRAVLDRLQAQVATFETKLAEAERVASTDALTRLRSRLWMETQIEQRIAVGMPFCIGLLDLDGFKSVNDEHGHVVGDDVLKQFAAELKSTCRTTDLVGRWGGDEFLLLLNSPLAQAQLQVNRVSKWVCGTYTVKRDITPLVLHVNASIGLAEFAPPESMTQLLDRADAAMYAGKPTGLGGEARRKP